MIRRRIARRGDVYWIDPNPIAGREIKARHRFVVITPKAINALGIAMTVPVTSAGTFARDSAFSKVKG
jgi:mRNA interferase ChpB